MVSERVYIAEVESVAPEQPGRSKLAWAKPVVQSTAAQGAWEGPVPDVIQKFPEKGSVFWFDAPFEAAEGDYWEVKVSESPQYDGRRNSEKYQVVDYQRPVEIIDLRAWKEGELRRALNSKGISIEPAPINPDIVLWVAENRWIGPVEVREASNGRWVLEASDPTRLNCWNPGQNAHCEVQLDESRLVVTPGHDYGESCGYVNWAPDIEFAEGVLKRIRKLDRSAYEALDVTYAVFEKYQEVLAGSGLSGPELQHERARLERVEELRNIVESNEKLLEKTVSALLESATVQSELEEEKQKLRSEIKNRLKSEINEELESKRSEIEELDERIEKQRNEHEEVGAKIAEEKETLESLVDSFEDALQEKLSELAKVELQDIFADSVALRAMLAVSGNNASATHPEEDASPALWENYEECEYFDEAKGALSSFSKQLMASGIGDVAMGVDVFSAFIGGGAACLTGERTDEVLGLLADTVAGGRMLWIPVSAVNVTPSDLLVSQSNGATGPHPNGLLETLVEAESSDELYLVVLEGFNRAPVESYLHPLLASLAESSTLSGGRRRKIPLPTRAMVAGTPVMRVSWPANVLLACIPTAGVTTNLPIPRSFWNYASLIDTDSYEDGDVSNLFNLENNRSPMAIKAPIWSDLRRRMFQKVDLAPLKSALRSALDSATSLTHGGLSESSYAAARSIGKSEDDALATAARLSVLPQMGYEMSSPRQGVAECFHLDDETAGTIFDLVQSHFS